MDIKDLALITLIGRLIAVVFMIIVIRKQIVLFQRSIPREIIWFRVLLFALALVILLGNIIPAVVDIATILSKDALLRPDVPSEAGVLYVVSNCITAILSTIFIWSLYRIASDTDATVKFEASQLKILTDKKYKDK